MRAAWAFSPKRLLVLSLALLAVALGLWLLFRNRSEPKYGGHRLSFWLGHHYFVPSSSQGKPLPFVLSDEASHAVRQVGTNGLPTLLGLMTYPDHGVRSGVLSLLQNERIPLRIRYLMAPMASYGPDRAVVGFRALGPEARNAIPALLPLLHNRRDSMWAVMALCALGNEGALACAAELPKIRDDNVRDEALNLRNLVGQEQLELFVPMLVEGLKADPEERCRRAAAEDLKSVLPALTLALSDSDPTVRTNAANALRSFRRQTVERIRAVDIQVAGSRPCARRELQA